MTTAADQLLGGRYRLAERIAGGGMGEVWRAQDEVLGRLVAVKIMRKEYADDPTFLERFRAEARHAAGLSHANIAAVYDFGNGGAGDAGSPFLVMEHVPGEPLSALVAREGALTADRTLEIVGQAALGLQAAHDAGVVHRDVKPGNILVRPDGQVRITDFGIARAANSVPLTQTGAIMGTAYYISPEQASGGSVTPASDIYSLGVVAYECLTGRRPFAGDTPVSVALAQVRDQPPALPAALAPPVRDLVMRMLAKEPGDRPASAGALGREALSLAPAVRRQATTEATRVLPVPGVAAGAAADLGPATPGHGTTTVVTRRDQDTDPGFHLPAPSQLPTWLPYAAGLVALAVLLLLVAQACGSDDAEPVAGTSAASKAADGEAGVEVDPADYLGRPVAQARAELEGLGLRVTVDRTVGGGEVGTVKAIAPTGSVPPGGQVALEAVAAPPPQDSDDDEDGDEGNGKGKGKGKNEDKGRGNDSGDEGDD
jgi:serine/threonine-protein kinase